MSLSGKYTTIERVLDRVHSDYGIDFHIPFGDALEWIGDAMDMIGVPDSYEQKIADITISNFRGTLPCELFEIDPPIRFKDTGEALLESTNTFHNAHTEDFDIKDGSSFYDYKIEGNYIKTNFEDGVIQVAYLAFPVDDRGYPKVPQDTQYLRAVVSYIAEKIAFIQLGAGKISERFYDRILQKKSFHFRQASTYVNTPSIAEAESMKNYMQRLVKHPDLYAKGFKYMNTPEKLKF